MINELAIEIHKNNVEKGFYEGPKNTGEMLCLIHSEISEALEADRTGHVADIEMFKELIEGYTWEDSPLSFEDSFRKYMKNSFEDELADVMIRVMDMAAFKGIDLDFHIRHKMEYNKRRPHKHGGKKY